MAETILEKDNEELRFLDNINIENRNNFLTQAKVIAIDGKNVIIQVTDKCTTSVPLSDLKTIPDIKTGTVFDIFVEQLEDSMGQIIVSRTKAEIVKKWNELYASLNDGAIVKGIVKSKLVGGVSVDINGISAFLPSSQIENAEVDNLDAYIGKEMPVIVTKINTKTKNVIVSHKLILENAIKAKEKLIFEQLKIGDVVEGTVESICTYGAFVNAGGISGLLHIADISWTRISSPEDVLSVGDNIKVVVIDCDKKTQKVSFGLKYLTKSPWEELDKEKISVGKVVEGKVVNIVDYGAFIEVSPGIEGLLHVTDLSWNLQAPSIKTICKVGDMIKTKIIDLNEQDQKLSLGLKQLSDDPWSSEDFDNVMAINSIHECKVVDIKPFGAIVELENGVYGFIHTSDLSWTQTKPVIQDFVKVNDVIKAVVLSSDKGSRKLSLGVKQLKENPWEKYEKEFEEESLHEGTVLNFKRKTNFFMIQLEYDMVAMLRKDHLPASLSLNVGDKITVKVIEYDKIKMKINVVHKDYKYHKQSSAKQQEMKINKNVTFGDICGLKK